MNVAHPSTLLRAGTSRMKTRRSRQRLDLFSGTKQRFVLRVKEENLYG